MPVNPKELLAAAGESAAWRAITATISATAWSGEQAFPPFLEHLFPHAAEYIGTDIEPGDDVDLVADVHRLTQYTGEAAFDIVLTEAGFEHFKYPHLSAHEIMKSLRLGGLVFVQTHQTFPIHAVPHDYFRFSTDALRSLFGERMGMRMHAAGYGSPAAIYSRVDRRGHRQPAFLHVNLFAEKVAPTPAEYVYEFDCLV